MRIAGRKIAFGEPCFIIAEIGINHNGDMNLAAQTIRAAKQAGVDAVKFQSYRTEDFLLNKELTHEYISQEQKVVENQYDMFKRYELQADQLRELKACCDDNGVIFFSTPTSIEGIELLQNMGVPVLKNGSDFLTHYPLIAAMAKSGIPTIISTGMATKQEIEEAVSTFEQAGGCELSILHCTSSYPTPAKGVNLRKITELAQHFAHPIGFSDHSEGIVAAVGAVSMGACLIEKHITFDKTLPGPDHVFSADPSELKALVDAVRRLEESLGNAAIEPCKEEQMPRREYRLSCVATRDLSANHVLEASDIALSRPATGLPPKFAAQLPGKTLKQSLKAYMPITAEVVDLT